MEIKLEIAKETAQKMAQEYEVAYLKTKRVVLKVDNLINKAEDEDAADLTGADTLSQEIQVKKNLFCRICKNIPVAPVLQSTCCREFYCEVCLKLAREEDTDRKVSCKNKRCTKGEEFETEPIGRLMRNIMASFEFKNDSGDELRNYQTEIKEQTNAFKEAAVHQCKLCDDKMLMTRADLEDHLVNTCSAFEHQCCHCDAKHARTDFFNKEKHCCLTNLKRDLAETRDKLATCQKNLEASSKKVTDLENRVKQLEQSIENMTKRIEDQKALISKMYGTNEQLQEEFFIEQIMPDGFMTIKDMRGAEPVEGNTWSVDAGTIQTSDFIGFYVQLKKPLFVNKMELDVVGKLKAKPDEIEQEQWLNDLKACHGAGYMQIVTVDSEGKHLVWKDFKFKMRHEEVADQVCEPAELVRHPHMVGKSHVNKLLIKMNISTTNLEQKYRDMLESIELKSVKLFN